MKRFLLAAFAFACGVCLFGCSPKTSTSEFWSMDTYCTVTASSSGVSAAQNAVNVSASLLEKDGGEENYLFADDKTSFELSEPVFEAVKISLEISKLTDGAFDITVAPLSKLWNVTERTEPPSDTEITSALKLVGYENAELVGNTVTFRFSGCGIDIGAVGKGMASKAAVNALKENGDKEAVVNLGGNVTVLGNKDGDGYKIGIRDPKSDGIFGYVTASDTSVVTSGVYERNFEYDGKIYHHILNTKTGYPVDNGILSATVVCDDPVAADVLSTAFFAVGKDDAEELFEKCEVYGLRSVIFVSENGGVYVVGNKELLTLTNEEYFFEN